MSFPSGKIKKRTLLAFLTPFPPVQVMFLLACFVSAQEFSTVFICLFTMDVYKEKQMCFNHLLRLKRYYYAVN